MTTTYWRDLVAQKRAQRLQAAAEHFTQHHSTRDCPSDIALVMAKSHPELDVALSMGADPNAMDGFFVKLLLSRRSHFWGDRVLALQKLLHHGFDAKTLNDDGSSALHECERSDLARVLLAAGCSTHRASGAYSAPLWGALQNGNWDVAGALMEHGCKLDLLQGGVATCSFLLKSILQKPHVWHHSVMDLIVQECTQTMPTNFWNTPSIQQMVLFAVVYRSAHEHAAPVRQNSEAFDGFGRPNQDGFSPAWLSVLARACGVDLYASWEGLVDQINPHAPDPDVSFLSPQPHHAGPSNAKPQSRLDVLSKFFAFPATWLFYQRLQHIAPDDINDQDTYRNNMRVHLHEAIKTNNQDLVRFLLDYGHESAAKDQNKDGWTALHTACSAHLHTMIDDIALRVPQDVLQDLIQSRHPTLAHTVFAQSLRSGNAWRASFAYQPDLVLARLLDLGASLDGLGQPPAPLNPGTLSALECNMAEEICRELAAQWSQMGMPDGDQCPSREKNRKM